MEANARTRVTAYLADRAEAGMSHEDIVHDLTGAGTALYASDVQALLDLVSELLTNDATVLALPPSLGDYGQPFRDRCKATVIALLANDAAVLAVLETDPSEGGYANYADQQMAGYVRTIDRSLRTLIKDALSRLEQLYEGTLPSNDAGSAANTARADYAEAIAAFAAMRDGIHWLLAKQAREKEETPAP